MNSIDAAARRVDTITVALNAGSRPVSEEEYDYPDPPRMQPGTKVAIALIGACLLLAVVFVIVAASRQSGEPEAKTVPQRSSPRPTQAVEPSPEIRYYREKDDGSLVWVFVLVVCTMSLLWLVALILSLIWVVKDSRARGSDGAMWIIVILLIGLFGLLIYLASRPAGMLVPCVHCGNQRLQSMRVCPICGRGSKKSKRAADEQYDE
jgi:hypothetical protein